MSPLTCRSYAYDLLRWFRVLWTVDVGWEQATEAEAAALVGWLRSARNPQRQRRREGGHPPGVVNPTTGKRVLAAGYAPATIAHNLSAVHGFYAFHLHFGRGPVLNPVPENRARRATLAHRFAVGDSWPTSPGPSESEGPSPSAAGDSRCPVGGAVRADAVRPG
ncbi:hypothetical protein AB0K68_19000 [Streptomyces sp. NPDC050698]